MNRRYCIHYGDYAIGENEQLYETMARKGWRLVKRGTYLSRFARCEPQERKYRIELSSPQFLDGDQELPEEQVQLYADCGWEFVTRCGLIHVFTAPAGSDAPEFYSDPRQQAATLRALRRGYWLGWLTAALVVGFNFLMLLAVQGGEPAQQLSKLGAEICLSWVRATAPFVLYSLFWFWALISSIYGSVRTMALYHRLKKGVPINHEPRRHYALRNAALAGKWALLLVFAVLSIVQYAGTQKQEMPLQSDGPYLTLSDLGWGSQRTTMFYLEESSSVETSRSLAAQMWNTYECVLDEAGRERWMYQKVYQVSTPAAAQRLAQWLMWDATFAKGPQDFEPVLIEGLDDAYSCGMDSIAVQGEWVWYTTASWTSTEQEREYDVLHALGATFGAKETAQ